MKNNWPTLKHKRIYDTVRSWILSGRYQPGQQLPTQDMLAKEFDATRPTVARALQRLEEQGLIECRQGSGIFIRQNTIDPANLTLGILIPRIAIQPENLERTIFGALIPQISLAGSLTGSSVIFEGYPHPPGRFTMSEVHQVCQRLIDHKISGVLFVPFEFTENRVPINQEIITFFEHAGIAVVLLDRDVLQYPHRSRYDLIGIHHERASFRLTNHLLEQGCRNICFLVNPVRSSAITARIAGFYSALFNDSKTPHSHSVFSIPLSQDSATKEILRQLIQQQAPDAFICLNDEAAGLTMRCLLDLGIKIPQDIKVVGFDDAPIASLLAVPLTTIRQPIQALAYEAVQALLDRIKSPQRLAREILVAEELIIRQSSGMSKISS